MTLDSTTTLWTHDGAAADLVRGVKYGRRTGGISTIAERLARVVPEVDLITWAPAAASTLRRRGFDQAELLARAVAARRGVRCRRLLVRGRGPAQTERDAAGRRVGPRLQARHRLRPGLRILVVDDVVTTGATLSAAAAVLRGAGAAEVHGAAATRALHRPIRTDQAPGCTVWSEA